MLGEASPLLSHSKRGRVSSLLPLDPASSPAAPAATRCGLLFDRLSLALLVLCCLGWVGYAAWQVHYLAVFQPRATFAALAPPLALMFMLISLPLSLYDVAHHVARYQHPIQRLYVRILLLPPIYSVESYVAVTAKDSHLQFTMETLRECYECVALLAVFHLACETLGKQRDVVAILNEGPEVYAARLRAEAAAAQLAAQAAGSSPSSQASPGAAAASPEPTALSSPPEEEPDYLSRTERIMLGLLDGSIFCGGSGSSSSSSSSSKGSSKGSSSSGREDHTVPLILPFCCCGRWRLGASFLNRCRFGVAQYVLVRVVCSIVFVSLESQGKAGGDGLTSGWGSADLWIYVVINASQLWALYCLVFFASVLWPALKPLRPINKFLLVKLVVFGFWWQSVMLELLGGTQLLDGLSAGQGPDYYANVTLQDLLITCEVMVIAVCHHFVFGVGDFQRPDMQAALHSQGSRGRSGSSGSSSGSSGRRRLGSRGSSSKGSSLGLLGEGGEGAVPLLAAEAGAGSEGQLGGSGSRGASINARRGGASSPSSEAFMVGGGGGAAAAGASQAGGEEEGEGQQQQQQQEGEGSEGGGALDALSPELAGERGPLLSDLLMLDVATDTARVLRNAGSAVGSTVAALARTLSPAHSRRKKLASDEGFYVAEDAGAHI